MRSWAAGAGVLALVAILLGSTLSKHEVAPATRSVMRVGALEGTQIPAYVDAARRELAGLAAAGTMPVTALVSMTGYGTPAQLARLGAGYAVRRAYFRVPLPDVQTEIRWADVAHLPADLEARMRSGAAQAERDAKEADTQVARLTGGAAKEQQLRDFYIGSARLLRSQAAQYRSLCACVYAFVLKAAPQDLVALARRPGIRVIDPAPEIASLDAAVFLPVLPEQRVTVQPPVDAGLPPVGDVPGPSRSAPARSAQPSPS